MDEHRSEQVGPLLLGSGCAEFCPRTMWAERSLSIHTE